MERMDWNQSEVGKLSKPTRIVIADDHAVLLESLAALLETQPDFAVVGTALNGTETVATVNRERPDILLLDLFMPEGDGFDVLRTLDRSSAQVASLILTGSENHLDYVQVVKLGARGLVLKGENSGRLFSAIRTVANGELAFSTEIANQVVQAMAAEPRQEPSNLSRLSERERQIAMLVARGMKNRDIATDLHISENTVKRHLQSIFSKTGTRDRLELAVLAVTDFSKAA
jgi:DNA-binding NarL/FixJ family response regulator